MSDEPPVRLAAVDVRERPEDEDVPECYVLCTDEHLRQTKIRVDARMYLELLHAVRDDRMKVLNALCRQLEQERDEARDMLNDWHELAKDAKPDCGGIGDGYLIAPMKEIEFRLLREATSAFLAKHPQPAKEQVE
jgi:hypothetical protein